MASTGHKGSINGSGCVGHALSDHSGMQVHLVASTGHKGSINGSGCVGHALSDSDLGKGVISKMASNMAVRILQ